MNDMNMNIIAFSMGGVIIILFILILRLALILSKRIKRSLSIIFEGIDNVISKLNFITKIKIDE